MGLQNKHTPPPCTPQDQHVVGSGQFNRKTVISAANHVSTLLVSQPKLQYNSALVHTKGISCIDTGQMTRLHLCSGHISSPSGSARDAKHLSASCGYFAVVARGKAVATAISSNVDIALSNGLTKITIPITPRAKRCARAQLHSKNKGPTQKQSVARAVNSVPLTTSHAGMSHTTVCGEVSLLKRVHHTTYTVPQ